MALQRAVNYGQASVTVGEVSKGGQVLSRAKILDSTNPLNNVIGRAFTRKTDETAQAGGAGVFYGIFTGTHQQANFSAQLDASLQVANGATAELTYMATAVGVYLSTAANFGDKVAYADATGILAAYAPGGSVPAGHTAIPNCTVCGKATTAAGINEIRLGD